MNGAVSPNAVPRAARIAFISALALSGIEVFGAATDLSILLNLPELEAIEPPGLALVQESQRETIRLVEGAKLASVKSTLESMSTSRGFILIGLSACALMAFLSALRMRWPSGMPRAASARLVGGAAYAAALMRTLDGAQMLVITRRAVAAGAKALETTPDEALSMSATAGGAIQLALSAVLTVVLVTGFVVVGHSFRSERLQSLLVKLDGPEPEPDDE